MTNQRNSFYRVHTSTLSKLTKSTKVSVQTSQKTETIPLTLSDRIEILYSTPGYREDFAQDRHCASL